MALTHMSKQPEVAIIQLHHTMLLAMIALSPAVGKRVHHPLIALTLPIYVRRQKYRVLDPERAVGSFGNGR